MKRFAIGGSLLFVSLLTSPGWAQEPIDGHQFLPESEWRSLPASAAGNRYYVEGRWNGIRLEDVSLYKANTEGVLFVKARTPVQGYLAGDKDSSRTRMEKRHSTVRLFVTAEAQGNRCVLWINKARKLEDDAVKYGRTLDELPSEVTPEAIHDLAEEIRARAARYDDQELAEVAQRAVQLELHARRSGLSKDDYDGALALAERMVEVGDEDGAIQVLSDFEEDADNATKLKLRQQLRRMGAVNSGGKWLPFTEFKRREGFIRRPGEGSDGWVRQEWAEFQAVIDGERKLQEQMVVPARKNELRHYRDAEQGRIVRGQTMAEVRLAVKGQLPKLANHVRALAPGPTAARTALWSQWVLEDGRRVYFLDQGSGGEVIAFKAAQAAWPR